MKSLLQTVETMAAAMGRGATAATASRAESQMGVQASPALMVSFSCVTRSSGMLIRSPRGVPGELLLFFLIRGFRRREYRELTQESMSVADYEPRFTSLSRYAPEMLTSEGLRCSRFEGGLRTETFTLLMESRIRVYPTLVSAAMYAEEGFKFRRAQENRSRQGKLSKSTDDRAAERHRPVGYAQPQPSKVGGSTATGRTRSNDFPRIASLCVPRPNRPDGDPSVYLSHCWPQQCSMKFRVTLVIVWINSGKRISEWQPPQHRQDLLSLEPGQARASSVVRRDAMSHSAHCREQ